MPDKTVPEEPKKSDAEESAKSKEDWQEQEDFLEESLEETFPGSDPISPGHPKKKD